MTIKESDLEKAVKLQEKGARHGFHLKFDTDRRMIGDAVFDEAAAQNKKLKEINSIKNEGQKKKKLKEFYESSLYDEDGVLNPNNIPKYTQEISSRITDHTLGEGDYKDRGYKFSLGVGADLPGLPGSGKERAMKGTTGSTTLENKSTIDKVLQETGDVDKALSAPGSQTNNYLQGIAATNVMPVANLSTPDKIADAKKIIPKYTSIKSVNDASDEDVRRIWQDLLTSGGKTIRGDYTKVKGVKY